jgi:hypothetical protein
MGRCGIKAVLPIKDDQKDHHRVRGRRDGRPYASSKLKQFRAVVGWYDKRVLVYQGTTDVASIRIRLHDPPQDLKATPSPGQRGCRTTRRDRPH